MQKVDKKLYYMLNPEPERIKYASNKSKTERVPYHLSSPWDYREEQVDELEASTMVFNL